MDLVTLCPFVASKVVWQANSGAFALTVIVKATFVLQPGMAQLAPQQEPILEQDRFYDDDPRRSVRVPSDAVPYKPRADVLLVGHAYAPGKQPVRSVVTRFVVGEMDKSIEVWCDRAFRVRDGQLLEGKRFTEMPLVWERASGGPESVNPVGKRFDGAMDAYGTIAIGNLQPLGHFVAKRSDTFVPTCYGPVAPTWPGRTQRLGRLSRSILGSAWNAQALPAGFDPTFFLAAPPDQNVAEIRANERIVLENLHPDHARLLTSLPGLHPRAIADRATGEREEIALVGDTLWIDTDRGVCCVVWRGRIGLRSADEAGRISITMDGGTAESGEANELQMTLPPQSPAVQQDDEDLAVKTMFGTFVPQASAPVMPFAGADKPTSASDAIRNVADGALPFGGGLAALRVVEPAAAPQVSDRTMFVQLPKIAMQDAPAAEAPQLPAPPPLVAPPPMIIKPPVIDPIAPVVGPSAWSSTPVENKPAPTVGEMMVQAQNEAPIAKEPLPHGGTALAKEEVGPTVVDEAAAKRGWKPLNGKSGESSKGPALVPNAVLMGAAAASDAAAGDRPKGTSEKRGGAASAPVTPPKAVIELLWFDSAAMPRIRRNPAWKEVLGQIKSKAFEDELSGDSPPEKRQEARDKRDIAGLLARGDATDMAGLNLALANAVTDDGTFIPPLVLLAGDLEFPFDELETLKATIAALTPLASGDKPLKEQLDTTEELLKTPWLKGASGIAEGLTAKLKEVYGRGNRVLPPRYLEGHTERMLLEQRAYQKRTVLGKTCIRSLLHLAGVQGGIPVYLPESLGQELPAFQRFAVRMISEVRGKVDQYETQEVAVRGVGVGRGIISRK